MISVVLSLTNQYVLRYNLLSGVCIIVHVQGAKKLVSDSPGRVGFALILPKGQVKVLGKFFLRKLGKLEN